ncbi:class I SAM-dependent methyltransferase [Paenibacillus sp. P26]|nr:class I SAM-dependent methyltransferase [Paenibacillus sp. P26]
MDDGQDPRSGPPDPRAQFVRLHGGATVACASAGAEVCHVDAAKGMVQWAKENVQLSGLGDRKVRFITDDVFKFVQREQRRGSKYDAIIMDPLPTAAGRAARRGSWRRICIRSWNPA